MRRTDCFGSHTTIAAYPLLNRKGTVATRQFPFGFFRRSQIKRNIMYRNHFPFHVLRTLIQGLCFSTYLFELKNKLFVVINFSYLNHFTFGKKTFIILLSFYKLAIACIY